METIEKRPRVWLSARAENLVEPNRRIKEKIAEACEVTIWTVQRWFNDKDERITGATALAVIREETGLPDTELLAEMS